MVTEKKEGAALAAPVIVRTITPIVRLGGRLATLLILVAFALTIYSIFMRYVLTKPVVWIDELTGYILVALIMFGVTEAYRTHSHIAIDLLTGRLQGFAKRIKDAWSDICVIGFSLVLGISTWDAIEFARTFGSYSPGEIEIQTWVPQIPMLLAAILLGLFALARLIGRFSDGGSK